LKKKLIFSHSRT